MKDKLIGLKTSWVEDTRDEHSTYEDVFIAYLQWKSRRWVLSVWDITLILNQDLRRSFERRLSGLGHPSVQGHITYDLERLR